MNSNLTKVWIFIISTGLFLLVVGYNLGDRVGLLFGFLAAILLNVLVFLFGEDRMLKQVNARQLSGHDGYGLNQRTKSMADQLELPLPRIFVFESQLPTAFCIGHSWHKSSLCFSTSLLDKLEQKEVDAVIAHLLCRIQRWDTFGYSVSSTLANTVVGFGEALDRALPFPLFKHLLSPMGWLIIKFITREKALFENDLHASELLEDRFALGKTLWKLNGYAQSSPIKVPPCTSHLFIVDPEGGSQKNIFLRSHPKISNRLNHLLGYFPP